eukprot:6202842-Pleurochrysis_carterae.AAC.8
MSANSSRSWDMDMYEVSCSATCEARISIFKLGAASEAIALGKTRGHSASAALDATTAARRACEGVPKRSVAVITVTLAARCCVLCRTQPAS